MFFLVAFSVLFGMHYYLFSHLRAAYPQFTGVLAVVLGALMALPFLLFFTRSRGKHTLAKFFARSGFSWLGLLWIAVCVLAALDAFNLIAGLAGGLPLSPSRLVSIAATVTGIAAAYGAVEARTPRLKRIPLTSKKLNALARPIRIVQITDLHLGYVADRRRLRRLLERIRVLAPDVIVSTGDLFDGNFHQISPFAAMLRECEAPLGKFAISGNHELYEDLEAGLRLAEEAGFQVLRGESAAINDHLAIAGVDDDEALAENPGQPGEAEALAHVPRGAFVVLLKHRPSVRQESLGKFGLQLSGHTHGGQIFPFGLLTRIQYPVRPGLTRLDGDAWLYLSRGTGTWGPQIRLFAPPEITLIELRGESIADTEAG